MLASRYDLVVFEDLRVRAMLRSARGTLDAPGRNVAQKTGLNRRIASSAWSRLVLRTRQKAEASGGEVVLVHAKDTSRTCSACGHAADENRPSQAVFRCVACGHTANADVNAATNIRARGLRVPARGGRPDVGAPSEARTTGTEAA
jgi:transposase